MSVVVLQVRLPILKYGLNKNELGITDTNFEQRVIVFRNCKLPHRFVTLKSNTVIKLTD
jgi:hypothetical protein